ncbi:MAG: lysostaphin resistance A-like protein [Pikeienuella sp.]
MDTISRLLGRTVLFDDYCDLAHPRAALWRLICGALTFGAFLLAFTVGGFFLLKLLLPEIGATDLLDLTTPQGTLIALGTFLAWPPALALALWIWHRRGLASLINEDRRVRLISYLKGFAIAVIIGVLTLFLGSVVIGMPTPAPVVSDWAMFAGFAFVLLIIQTGSEELFFRGYLQQQFGARVRTGLWWGVLPSVLFGALHWNPDSFGGGAAIVILTTGVFGLAMAVIVARTGDLSLVMGLHLGVNFVALLLAAPSNYLSGLALFHWPNDNGALTVLGWMDFGVLCAVCIAALFWDQRRRNLSDLPDVFV